MPGREEGGGEESGHQVLHFLEAIRYNINVALKIKINFVYQWWWGIVITR